MRIPDLSEVPELQVQAEAEYNLRIVSAKDTVSGNTGREGVRMVIHNLDVDNAVPIFESIWFPMEVDDKAKADNMWRRVRGFLNSLGLPTTGCDTEDLIGKEFRALVGIRKAYNSEEDENYIARVVES